MTPQEHKELLVPTERARKAIASSTQRAKRSGSAAYSKLRKAQQYISEALSEIHKENQQA